MKITTLAISNSNWNTQIFSVVVLQIKDSARKVLKGIDVGIERKRFNNSCNILENLAIQNGTEIKVQETKLQEIFDTISITSNALLPFIEYDKLKSLIKHFDEVEWKKITDSKSAIVFVLNEYSTGTIEIKLKDGQTTGTIESNISELNRIVTDKIEQKRFDEQILYAIKTGNPIGWINIEHISGSVITGKTHEERKGQLEAQKLLRHEGIITCLREHIYASKQPTAIKEFDLEKTIIDKEANEKREKDFWFQVLNFFSKQSPLMKKIKIKEPRTVTLDIIPQKVHFAFEDGSISDFFPLYAMVETKPKEKLQSLKVALISNRHFELDNIVETCIIRNSEIGRFEEATIAEQEKLSFDIAEKFFQDVIEKTEGVHIELYHTGLEPAVIGTYRALLGILLKKGNRGKIIVTPKVKAGDKFDDLKQWY